jgi:hypothetical protein
MPEAPEVPQIEAFPDLLWVWNAFWRLSNKRPQGFNGPLRIPDSEVLARCRLEGWDFSRRLDFAFYLEKLDEAYMAHIAKLQKEEEDKRQREARNRIPPRKR